MEKEKKEKLEKIISELYNYSSKVLTTEGFTKSVVDLLTLSREAVASEVECEGVEKAKKQTPISVINQLLDDNKASYKLLQKEHKKLFKELIDSLILKYDDKNNKASYSLAINQDLLIKFVNFTTASGAIKDDVLTITTSEGFAIYNNEFKKFILDAVVTSLSPALEETAKKSKQLVLRGLKIGVASIYNNLNKYVLMYRKFLDKNDLQVKPLIEE